MIIVDEAYIDFATKPGVRTAVPLIEEHPNVIVMRTFSKAHALAGVRVGYAIGDPEVIGAIQALLVPFGVNSLALAAALASLKDAEGVQRAVAEIIAERERIIPALRALGYDIPDSQSNFYLIRGRRLRPRRGVCARRPHRAPLPRGRARLGRLARAERPLSVRRHRVCTNRGHRRVGVRARRGPKQSGQRPLHPSRCSGLRDQQRDNEEN